MVENSQEKVSQDGMISDISIAECDIFAVEVKLLFCLEFGFSRGS